MQLQWNILLIYRIFKDIISMCNEAAVDMKTLIQK